jgi:phosphoheptose isomerase
MKGHIENVRAALATLDYEQLRMAENLIAKAVQIFVCGNGGSHANALHLGAHLADIYDIRVLGNNPVRMTAVSNDYGYATVFSNDLQVFTPGQTTDLLIIFSCSGTSENIVDAIDALPYAQVLLLTGQEIEAGRFTQMDGNPVRVVNVKSKDFGVIEDVHSAIIHALDGTLRAKKDVRGSSVVE